MIMLGTCMICMLCLVMHCCQFNVVLHCLLKLAQQYFDALKTNVSTILHTVAGALHRPHRSADTQSGGDSVNTSSFPYIEVLRGRDGRDGRDGVPGSRGSQGQRGEQGVTGPPGPRNGGVVYTRWGKSSCPNVSGTTLVYAGRVGGTYRIAGNFRWVQIFAIFADKPASAKIKTAKKCTKNGN